MVFCEHCKKARHCRVDAEANAARESPITRLGNLRAALAHPEDYSKEELHHMEQSVIGLELALERIQARRRTKKREYGCTAIE